MPKRIAFRFVALGTHHKGQLSVCFLALVVLGFAASVGQSADRPNIVLIFADDMGYGDPACFNPDSKNSTPNIDRLASEGIRMRDAHAPGSVCVPSRYGLLTGRYPFRATMNARNRPVIAEERYTIGHLLQDAGYRTTCVGKWHQGLTVRSYDLPLAGGPVDRGFHNFFGMPASLDIPPYYYIQGDRCVQPPSLRIEDRFSAGWTKIQGAFLRAGGVAPGFVHEEVTPRFTEKAVSEIHRLAANKRQPYFLYLALPSPHTPWLPVEEFQGKSQVGMYGDFMMQVDATVGKLLKAIDDTESADNTLVIFTSDNGPVWYPKDVERFGHSSTGPLRGMKGDAFEGGHRVPWIGRWPGHIEAGTESNQTLCHTDLMATFAAITEREIPTGAAEDSVNLLSALLGTAGEKPLRDSLITLSSRGVLSLRRGSLKYIDALGSGGFTQPSRVKPTAGQLSGQLYDLAEDLGETNDLSKMDSQRTREMKQFLQRVTANQR
jgi:arylsulfatase A